MLDELAVRNLGIISSARIEPGRGFAVISGETGAGKTMLLGALRLLIGENARSDLIGPHAEETVVEGRFVLDDVEITVSRRVTEGRSRAYLDGSMVPVKAVAERIGASVEIVGQHDQLSLTNQAELRRLIDCGIAKSGVVEDYRTAWAHLQQIENARRQLGGDRRALERELDLLSYQLDEINEAKFATGDDALLEAQASRLANADELRNSLGSGQQALERADEALGPAVDEIRKAAAMDEGLAGLGAVTEGLAAELAELVTQVREAGESVEQDPQSQADIELRLAKLGELRRKYGATLDDVLAFGIEAGMRRDQLSTTLERAATVDEEHAAAATDVGVAGARLLAARRKAGSALLSLALDHLKELGFSEPVLELVVTDAPPGPLGADKVELLFASDERLTPGPIGRTASGGELSRLVLSLRLAAGAALAPVVAFDEIDSGVGGETALAMGRKLAALGQDGQVLCVTHLPQVAAFADRHFVVSRDAATASVELVEGDRRLEELSRMLSGLPESEQGRAHAKELREMAMGLRLTPD